MTYGKLEDGNVTICRSSKRPSDGEWYPIRFKVPPKIDKEHHLGHHWEIINDHLVKVYDILEGADERRNAHEYKHEKEVSENG